QMTRVGPSLDITDAYAARILSETQEIFTQIDPCGADVACPIILTLRTLTFTRRIGTSVTAAELIKLRRDTGSFVLIVDRLDDRSCPPTPGGFAEGPGRILGCVGVARDYIAVVRWAPVRFGTVLAHEFGHARGLPHRSQRCAVMNATASN